MSGAKGEGGFLRIVTLNLKKDPFQIVVIQFQSSSSMEDRVRRLWLGWKPDELGDVVGTRNGSMFSSDGWEDERSG
jgi:hypothetical protein